MGLRAAALLGICLGGTGAGAGLGVGVGGTALGGGCGSRRGGEGAGCGCDVGSHVTMSSICPWPGGGILCEKRRRSSATSGSSEIFTSPSSWSRLENFSRTPPRSSSKICTMRGWYGLVTEPSRMFGKTSSSFQTVAHEARAAQTAEAAKTARCARVGGASRGHVCQELSGR